MTRKDYELLASVFAHYYESDKMTAAYNAKHDRPPSDTDTARATRLECIVETLCNDLQRENPRFNRGTFLKACGL